jgi:hypothetical protein
MSPGFVFYLVTRESVYYINLRQAYAFSPAYANRISSRTVLFTAVPDDYLDEAKLRRMFGAERIKHVWIATDVSKLEDKVKEREKAAMKLEGAEIKLIKQANAARLKSSKKGGNASEEDVRHLDSTADEDESGSVAARWLQQKKRPTHRLKFLIGKKVDTINWARAEIERLTPEIEELQARHRAVDVKKVSAVFVEFHTQSEAQAAYQSGMSPLFFCSVEHASNCRSGAQSAASHEPSLYRRGSRPSRLVQLTNHVVGARHSQLCDDWIHLRSDHLLGDSRRRRRCHFQHQLPDPESPFPQLHQRCPHSRQRCHHRSAPRGLDVGPDGYVAHCHSM